MDSSMGAVPDLSILPLFAILNASHPQVDKACPNRMINCALFYRKAANDVQANAHGNAMGNAPDSVILWVN